MRSEVRPVVEAPAKSEGKIPPVHEAGVHLDEVALELGYWKSERRWWIKDRSPDLGQFVGYRQSYLLIMAVLEERGEGIKDLLSSISA
ncbi:hypothetical protein RHS04_08891 [Rhizoctonia solani]|uniref:Uncharacterized protein n=1 Tax=Rhizoctonia solani TaxID=456999 RepID=A0A8H7GZ33_9AGAM|nr:hypothetical protein RHS04_08891 [Rhizoctonia solani]KAF8748484.1 hypothetical protein RHS01_10791 [Rhizoctonia solani]